MKYKEYIEIAEALIKKVVNFRGKITKSKTAGKKGRILTKGGKKRSRTGAEKKNLRKGLIKRKRSLKRISGGKKKRSRSRAAKGRAHRAKRNVKDFRSK